MDKKEFICYNNYATLLIKMELVYNFVYLYVTKVRYW